MRIGIFFGGSSREREISFAGGRTVYDNLNKSLFEPVPIFVDSYNNLCLLDWEYIYKGSIRDFYPSVNLLPDDLGEFQVYAESLNADKATQSDLLKEIGTPLNISDLGEHIDFAFLALHGKGGEDGSIQGILEFLGIPFSGSGIFASALGMDKYIQKRLMDKAGYPAPKMMLINKIDWKNTNDISDDYFNKVLEYIGTPVVVRPACQGSSIGVSILKKVNKENLQSAINDAFFIEIITAYSWNSLDEEAKYKKIQSLVDIREGIGLPLQLTSDLGSQTVYLPNKLIDLLNEQLQKVSEVTLDAFDSEQKVILESFLDGKEFSCVVLRNLENEPVALPPTEIVKGGEVYDYRSKYLPGLSRKITPIDLPIEQINDIRKACEDLYEDFYFDVYARIDGFMCTDGKIYLNDPNTTSGMLPSSFFFHQAAEIGLNPSEFLTTIIYSSLKERAKQAGNIQKPIALAKKLMNIIKSNQENATEKIKVAVVLGGFSSERHISVESGRNIYEKLASSDKYQPIPIFLTGSEENHELYQIPINVLLKDNADDIKDKIDNFKIHPIIDEIRTKTATITSNFSMLKTGFEPKAISYEELSKIADFVFIALHGRPGEDGSIQKYLTKYNLPFNGSDSHSSSVTINKFETLQKLKKNGFTVTHQKVVQKSDFKSNSETFLDSIEKEFTYPFIAKPVDDGCSSAVKVIKTKEELYNFSALIFCDDESAEKEYRAALGLKFNEEFPNKQCFLVEALISKEDAIDFMEITGGLLTSYDNESIVKYEMFEPSEALATDAILSLEEKFLAGEGQNITPARFGNKIDYPIIAKQVKKTLEEAAKILEVEGYARIDAFVRIFAENKVETIIIEINSLPGMTPATCIFHQSAINGYKPYDFIDRIIDFGIKRNKR